jgi:F-type H+-transporting ATPase subunit b
VRRAAAAALGLLLAPAAALASGGEEAGNERLWEWLNLVLMLGALIYFARKPVATFLRERRSGIERDLHGAEQLLRDAEGRLAEWRDRAARLDADVAEIKRVARAAAEQDSARIVAEARAVAERIRRDAASAVEREGKRAQERLRKETAERAVAAAERVLREKIEASDEGRLFDEFIARVETPTRRKQN